MVLINAPHNYYTNIRSNEYSIMQPFSLRPRFYSSLFKLIDCNQCANANASMCHLLLYHRIQAINLIMSSIKIDRHSMRSGNVSDLRIKTISKFTPLIVYINLWRFWNVSRYISPEVSTALAQKYISRKSSGCLNIVDGAFGMWNFIGRTMASANWLKRNSRRRPPKNHQKSIHKQSLTKWCTQNFKQFFYTGTNWRFSINARFELNYRFECFTLSSDSDDKKK